MNRVLFPLVLLVAFLLPGAVMAQVVTLNMGEGGGEAASRMVQLIALITILSLSPSILVMVTSFTRIIVVLSFLRSAMGLQQTPPNSVLISLALFMTFFIMQPVFTAAYDNGLKPLMEERITEEQAVEPVLAPFRTFMLKNVRSQDIGLFLSMIKDQEKIEKPEDTPMKALIPAFMLSELKRAFEIGFLIFIPFLIIDMLVASTLMAMGMMMLPPVIISLPFKLIFFVLIDGWHLVAGSLIRSFGM